MTTENISDEYEAVSMFSGGLDSTVSSLLADEEISGKILLLHIDVGTPSDSLSRARSRADSVGLDLQIVDGIDEFVSDYVSDSIKFRGSYWGYPLSTPLARAYQMEKLTDILDSAQYVVHGCAPYQNTRFRLEKHAIQFDLEAIGPNMRDDLSREDKIDLLDEYGIEVTPSDDYAEDENIWGRALEGEPLNTTGPIDEEFFKWTSSPKDAPDNPEIITLSFEGGVPVSLNGSDLELAEIIKRLQDVGGSHGIGRITTFEDTMPEVGHKQRGAFESPQSQIIYSAHKHIEDSVLNKANREIKQDLRYNWSKDVYEGGWFGSDREQMSQFNDTTQKQVNGEVKLELYKGNISVIDATVPENILLSSGERPGAY